MSNKHVKKPRRGMRRIRKSEPVTQFVTGGLSYTPATAKVYSNAKAKEARRWKSLNGPVTVRNIKDES